MIWSDRNIPFDAGRWHAPPSEQRNSWRKRMAYQLVKKRLLLGKARSEITAMLGPPSDAPWFRASNWDLIFDLYEVDFYLNSQGLAVKFDDGGLVTDAAVVTVR